MRERTGTPVEATGSGPLAREGEVITFPGHPRESSGCESEAVPKVRAGADRLIGISDIRALFKLGRTAAYELTHRSGFPAPVQLSPRCLRWWASEVHEYAVTLQRERDQFKARRTQIRQVDSSTTAPGRITGTVRAARGRKGSP